MSKTANDTAIPGREEKLRLLGSLAVFQSLDARELEAVADSSQWRIVRGGENVYPNPNVAASGSGRIFAIQEGEVLITKSTEKQKEIILATFVAGEGFGELSLFDRGSTDTVARCEEDSLLLVFPGNGAAVDPDAPQDVVLFREYPQIKAKLLRNLLARVASRIRSSNRLIAERSPWVQELRRQVMIDKLTGLYNSVYLEEELPRLLEQCSGFSAFLMIKPDNLKQLNDKYGHQAGDRTLQLMAEELRRQPEKGAVAIRYKGDVLSMILPGADLQGAEQCAERIREGMSGIDVSEVSLGSAEPRTDLRITVSVGIAVADGKGARAVDLVEHAYQTMFRARNDGGNRICSRQTP